MQQDRSAEQPPEQKARPALSSRLDESERGAGAEPMSSREIEQLKTRLFNAMAHELRTPLASLRLAAGLLISAPPPGATEIHHQLFQLILHSSDRMDLLITSLLDYARLQAQHLPLDLQSVDLRQVLESVADLLEPHYRAKKQTLDLQLPSGPLTVLGDPFRLKSAAQALLETACKRTPEHGKLSMGCRTHMGGALGWVCDTGPRVPEEARTDIFTQAYWQTMEDSPSLTAFGLGLPLAHGLITLHGGSLWLADPETVEEGICFHFSLPLASA